MRTAMLTKTDVVDLVTKDESSSWYQLILVVEEGEWEIPNSTALFQEKINSYLSYAFDGEMFEHYPDADKSKVELIINYVDAPPVSISVFIERIKKAVEKEGVSVKVIPLF
jgi:hypothetical protein